MSKSMLILVAQMRLQFRSASGRLMARFGERCRSGF
jgi:hypothetical protein